MTKIFFTTLFLLSTLISFAQPEGAATEMIDGKKFYVHTVQGGNTLYGISKLYNISAEKVLEFNPTSATGLQIGQRIVIPFDTKEEVKTTIIEQKQAPETHIVEKGDNLYNISKRYNVSMEDIVKLNPGVENGVNLAQEIKLPKSAKIDIEPVLPTTKTTISFQDSIITYTVLPHETMYSISKRFMVPIEDIQKANDMSNTRIRKGDVIKIPVKKEKVTKVEIRKIETIRPEKVDEELMFKAKKEYNVVYLLPFALDGGSNSLRGIATEFLMGAQLALDSLERLGFNAKIHVIDVESDTVKLKAQLNSKEVKGADLIIGPFLGRNVNFTTDWAKDNKIRLVSPLFSSTEILKDNPYIYNAVNSDITLIEGAAKYLAEKRKTDQIVLVKVDSKDDELYQAFRLKYYATLPKDSKTKLLECSVADIGGFIKKGGNTIFVVPSREKLFSVKFMNAVDKVSSKAGGGTITVFGTKDWINNEEIKGYYRNKYNLTFASPYDFSYSNEETKKMLKKYRVKYNADLSKYGVQGYDVSMYFIQDFFLSKPKSTGVMNKMLLKSVGPGSGYENKTCFIIKHDNYELIQVDLIYE